MLGLIGASREGNCVLHLAPIRQNGYFDASPDDKVNYLTWPTTMPWIHDVVTNRRTPWSAWLFCPDWPPEPLRAYTCWPESRPSRRLSTKTPRHQEAEKVSAWEMKLWWVLTSEFCSRYLRQLTNVIGQRDTDFGHPDRQLMETSWLNPFRPEHGQLDSLSTAAEVPEVVKDLLGNTSNFQLQACKKTFYLCRSIRRRQRWNCKRSLTSERSHAAKAVPKMWSKGWQKTVWPDSHQCRKQKAEAEICLGLFTIQ